MKKILTLVIVLGALLGVAWFKSNERNSRLNRSTGTTKHRKLLIEDFDINGIKKLHLKEDKKETTIEVKGDQWVVAERGGYPANKEKLQEQLMSLRFEEIKAARRVGKDSWGKIGVNSPGDATAYGVGTLVELHDESGAVKHSMVLGGKVTSSGGSADNPMSMFGGGAPGNRFIRLMNEESIYEVSNAYDGLNNDPAAWLLKDFVNVEKLKSVEVTHAKPEDSWKASKKAESDADFALEAPKAGEELDTGKATLASFLNAPSFDDVQPKDKAAELLKDAVKVTLTTFDGFTYTVQAAKKAVDGSDKYFMTITTTAKLADKRDPVKDEKEEDKKKNDEAFAATKKSLEEKLAKEKACDGWVYQVTEYTINTAFKKRSEIIKTADAKPAGQPGIPGLTPGSIPGLPPGMIPPPKPAAATPPPASATSTPITVTTPPISVPPAAEIKDKPKLPEAPKPELKPAEAPKPAEPTKADAK
jgi:hypothetical protein